MRRRVLWGVVAMAGLGFADPVYENALEGTVEGMVGNATYFSGGSFVNAGNVAPTGTAPRTVACWIKPDSDLAIQGVNKFFGYGSTVANTGFDLSYEGGSQGTGIFLREWGGALRWNVSGLAGNWTHIAVRVNDEATTFADVELFINGVSQGPADVEFAGAFADPIQTAASNLYIGDSSTQPGSAFFSGAIDEFKVFDTALSDDEIEALFRDVPVLPSVTMFEADDYYVEPGATVEIRWETADAGTVVLDSGIGDVTATRVADVGSTNFVASVTTTYTLTAENEAGRVVRSLRVGVGAPRPNILFFLVDDMGWQDTSVPLYYNAAGEPIVTSNNTLRRTPNMETLATKGCTFTSAYANSVCSPTRVSIMTGLNSARHHVTTWTHPNTPTRDTGQNNVAGITSPAAWRMEGMDASDIALPALLQQAGYRTIHVGKAHFGVNGYYAGDPTAIGFDLNIAGHGAGGPGSYLGTDNFGSGMWHVPGLEPYHGEDIFLSEALTREMNAALEQAVADDTPFFAYMAHYAVHVPWMVDSRFAANYPTLSGQALAYATLIEGMDKSLGDLLNKVQELGVAENTLVIFYSDNGSDMSNPVLRSIKGTCWEGGMRVPLIAAWAQPNATNAFQLARPISAGRVEHDMVSCDDLFPTVAAVAGVEYDHEIDGYDLTPYFSGEAGTHRPQEFLHHFPHGHGEDHFSVLRQGDWKLVYKYRETPIRELYNLSDDLGETNNLASREPERVVAMTRHLARELNRMGAQFTEFTDSGAAIPPAVPAFAEVDVDGDGLADVQEDPDLDGLVDEGETDPDNADTDCDGVSDGGEVRLGLDPLDAESRFCMAVGRGAVSNGVLQLAWPSSEGTTFTLRSCADLEHWATIVASNIPADAGTTTRYEVEANDDRLFFRVELEE